MRGKTQRDKKKGYYPSVLLCTNHFRLCVLLPPSVSHCVLSHPSHPSLRIPVSYSLPLCPPVSYGDGPFYGELPYYTEKYPILRRDYRSTERLSFYGETIVLRRDYRSTRRLSFYRETIVLRRDYRSTYRLSF